MATAPAPKKAPTKKAPAKKAAAPAVAEADLVEDEVDAPEVEEDSLPPIPTSLQFFTPKPTEEELAARARERPEADVVSFTIDGQELVATRPSDGAWTLILSAYSNAADLADRTQAIMQFVYASLDEMSRFYVSKRLMDNNDEFGVNVLADVVTALIEQWAPKQNRAARRAAAKVR
jgi:hypothetical protein